ncbi:MAG TPA: nucleotide exchange factor GrpE [Pyrinomonadaceae bacterium]|jgi:molecular chaperone GrpE|nr:nucleotide exchange factor GrpE [Pyrinomonadaceae bacterium]
MNPNQEIESLENAPLNADTDPMSVDEFIRQLEAKEKDLHITAETTVIEIAESFDDGELPEFLKDEFQEAPPKSVKPLAPQKKKAEGNTSLEAENKHLKDKITKLDDERVEMVKDSQRRAKDFSNYKSRVERERRETFQNQVANLAIQMLPALDNLNRAIDFALELPQEGEFRQFFDGVVLVNQQVNEVLAGMGIVPIATIGEMFDPHLHEAAATEETDEVEPNTVSAEILKGYRIGDRVIRHSIVRVAKRSAGSNEASVLEKMFDSDLSGGDQPSQPTEDEANDSTERSE